MVKIMPQNLVLRKSSSHYIMLLIKVVSNACRHYIIIIDNKIGKTDVVKYLVDEVKVDPLAKAKGGMTTLHAAVTAHQVSITKVNTLND